MSISTGTASDAALIAAVREGDTAAYGELFARHRQAADRLAHQLISGPGADDLVSEAFIKVLTVLQSGGGPDEAFRAYLLTAIRRLHIDAIRSGRRERSTDDETELDRQVAFVDPAAMEFERGAAGQAFRSLPERWQLVLWHLDVEGQNPAEISGLLDMTPNGVSALAYRAREGLRRAYLQQHLAPTLAAECRETTEKLGSYVRSGLGQRDSRKVEKHLDSCVRCTGLYLELREVNSSLAGVLGPVVLGSSALAYLGPSLAITTGASAAVGGGTVAGLSFSVQSIAAEASRAVATPLRSIGPGPSTAVAVTAVAAIAAGAVALTTGDDAPASPPTSAETQTRQEQTTQAPAQSTPAPAPATPQSEVADTPPSTTPPAQPTPTVSEPSTSPQKTPPATTAPEPSPEPNPEPTPVPTEPEPEPPTVGTDFALGDPVIVKGEVINLQRTVTIPISGTWDPNGVPADRTATITVEAIEGTPEGDVAALRPFTVDALPEGWSCDTETDLSEPSGFTCTSTLPAGLDSTFEFTITGQYPTGRVTLTADADPNDENNVVDFVSPPFYSAP